MSSEKQLYFVAIIPPEPIYAQVVSFKEDMAQRFGSKAALKSPPHITLHMPFRFREDREQDLIATLERAMTDFQPFELVHQGFAAFEPRVIYVDVNDSEPLHAFRAHVVSAMRQQLKLLNADYKDRPFNPHMTIAFRDLKKPAFFQAWADYQAKPFQASWMVQELVLLKHTGTKWCSYRHIR